LFPGRTHGKTDRRFPPPGTSARKDEQDEAEGAT
jgi:hypothetical protein